MTFRPVPEPRKTRKHLYMEEWLALLDVARWAGLFEYTLVRLLYETGMRAGEPGKLVLDHCKRLHHGQLYIPRGKGSVSDWFNLRDDTVELVVSWIDATHPHKGWRKPWSWLFPGARYRGTVRGVSRGKVWKLVKDLCERAQIPAAVSHTHAIRHARVQHLFEAAERDGVPYEAVLQTVAKIVGHKSAMTTFQHYIAEHGRGKQLAQDVLAAALGENDEND